jgi:hypothetical protein
MTSPGSHEVGRLERWKGQQWVGCRKTCGRGAQWTQILAMGCSTPQLDLERGAPGCRNNGRFSCGGNQGEGGEHELHRKVELSLAAVEKYTLVRYPGVSV